MEKVKMSIQIVAIFAILFTSCGKKTCKDELIGELPLSEKAENFVSFPDRDTLYYKDQIGNELAFIYSPIEEEKRISLRVIGNSNDFVAGEGNCYEYISTKTKFYNLLTPDADYRVFIQVTNEAESMDSSKEQIMFRFSTQFGGAKGLYNIESDSFDEVPDNVMDKLDSVELNGNTFSDVLRSTHEGNGGHVIYLKEGQGVIGFETIGEIFVLQ